MARLRGAGMDKLMEMTESVSQGGEEVGSGRKMNESTSSVTQPGGMKAPIMKTLTAATPPRRRETAETMATKQKDIAVSEFFAKNRHLLGFDNPKKALLTTVKEAVDNSLDACEEVRTLPEITVKLVRLSPKIQEPTPEEAEAKNTKKKNPIPNEKFCLTITDNGPGIVPAQIPKIFGKLLYGSKFHRLKMSRGQQGIGISAAGMYGQLTTGKPVKIISRTGEKSPAHYFEVQIDTKKNEPI